MVGWWAGGLPNALLPCTELQGSRIDMGQGQQPSSTHEPGIGVGEEMSGPDQWRPIVLRVSGQSQRALDRQVQANGGRRGGRVMVFRQSLEAGTAADLRLLCRGIGGG